MTPRPSPSADPARVGLRERKKARTKVAIQEAALRLFRANGYEATTVEQIAEAAEVSPSTFFRYYPTKDSVVFTDEYDDVLLASFAAQPPGLSALQAFRAAYTTTFEAVTEEEAELMAFRQQLVLTVPELRSSYVHALAQMTTLLATAVAQRAGRTEDDEEVLALSGAIIGVCLAVLTSVGFPSQVRDELARLDRALACLERGFSL